MKNMKKLLQKAMVFTLSAAMLVGTPMTASAAELVDLYSISDGTGVVDNDGTPVGTVTNTDTNTGFLIDSNKAEIVEIRLDKQTVKAEKGEKETLKATVVLNGKIIATDTIKNKEDFEICKPNDDITDLVVAEMSKKIKWEVLYVDANGNKREDMPNPAEKVELDLEVDSTGDRSVVTLNPLEGTKDGEEVTVRATIDAAWHFNVKPAEGESRTWEDRLQNDREQDTDKDAFYTAEAKVSVKEYSEKLEWRNSVSENTLLLKHTFDLGAELVRTPATANDTITWTSSNKNIPVSKDGVVTSKKEGTATITAKSEHGVTATRKITVDKGVKADVVKISSLSENNVDYNDITGKTTNKDLAKSEDSMTLKAVMYAKVEAYATNKVATEPATEDKVEDKEIAEPAGTVTKNVEVKNGDWYIGKDKKAHQVDITDVITWTSDKKTVAEVAADGSVTLKGVGTAKITAKATNGKSAKTTVKVAATLGTLEIGGAPKTTAYSGQSFNLTAIRTPSDANKDAVTWSIAKTSDNKKNPNATINAKTGVLKIANKVDEAIPVTIHLETSKAVKPEKDAEGKDTKVKVYAEDVTISVKQSTIDIISVTEKGAKTPIAVGGFDYNDEYKKLKGEKAISGTSTINIPLSKTFVATATNINGSVDASLLTWKSDKPKIATVEVSGANATIKAVGTGTATITVSGVRTDPKKDNKASTLSVKFKVQVKQPVTSFTMNKPTVELAQKDKNGKAQNQKVSLKVTFGPKKADKAQQKIKSWTVQKLGSAAETYQDSKGKDVTKASITYTLKEPAAGDVYKITATSVTGATATSTITIAAPTTAVQIVKKDGAAITDTEKELAVGGKLEIKAQVKVATNDAEWVDAGDKAAKAENVTYTVNKKGIVTIGNDGTIYAIKNGNVTITAKTPTGKKTTLKIKVKK